MEFYNGDGTPEQVQEAYNKLSSTYKKQNKLIDGLKAYVENYNNPVPAIIADGPVQYQVGRIVEALTDPELHRRRKEREHAVDMKMISFIGDATPIASLGKAGYELCRGNDLFVSDRKIGRVEGSLGLAMSAMGLKAEVQFVKGIGKRIVSQEVKAAARIALEGEKRLAHVANVTSNQPVNKTTARLVTSRGVKSKGIEKTGTNKMRQVTQDELNIIKPTVVQGERILPRSTVKKTGSQAVKSRYRLAKNSSNVLTQTRTVALKPEAKIPKTIPRQELIEEVLSRALTRYEKGEVGEAVVANLLKSRNYKILPSKYGSNNGLDIVAKKLDASGKVVDVLVIESKYSKEMRLRLTSRHGNKQGTNRYMKWQLGKMDKKLSRYPELQETIQILESEGKHIRFLGTVLGSDGSLNISITDKI